MLDAGNIITETSPAYFTWCMDRLERTQVTHIPHKAAHTGPPTARHSLTPHARTTGGYESEMPEEAAIGSKGLVVTCRLVRKQEKLMRYFCDRMCTKESMALVTAPYGS